MFGDALLGEVGEKRGRRDPARGDDADEEPDQPAPEDRPARGGPVLPGEEHVLQAYLLLEQPGSSSCSRLLNTSARPKMPQMMTMKSMPPSAGACRRHTGGRRSLCRARCRRWRAHQRGDDDLHGIAPAEDREHPEGHHRQAEVLGRSEAEREFRQGPGKDIRRMTESVPAIHEPIAATERAAPARPCLAI